MFFWLFVYCCFFPDDETLNDPQSAEGGHVRLCGSIPVKSAAARPPVFHQKLNSLPVSALHRG